MHPGKDPFIMTDQPSRVTPAEISALLDQARRIITDGASLDEQTSYHQRKAELLQRLADELHTSDAYLAAADAWGHVWTLCVRRSVETHGQVRP
jgi:hypothetical protein